MFSFILLFAFAFAEEATNTPTIPTTEKDCIANQKETHYVWNKDKCECETGYENISKDNTVLKCEKKPEEKKCPKVGQIENTDEKTKAETPCVCDKTNHFVDNTDEKTKAETPCVCAKDFTLKEGKCSGVNGVFILFAMILFFLF